MPDELSVVLEVRVRTSADSRYRSCWAAGANSISAAEPASTWKTLDGSVDNVESISTACRDHLGGPVGPINTTRSPLRMARSTPNIACRSRYSGLDNTEANWNALAVKSTKSAAAIGFQ